MVRVTKKKLKEDKLVSTTAKLSLFFSKHWKKLAIGAAGIIVIAVLIALYSFYLYQRNEKAAIVLSEARKLFSEAEDAIENEAQANNAKEKYEQAKIKFDEASRRSKSGYIDAKALFYSGKCSYQLGRYDEAIPIFQMLLKRHSKSVFAPYAREGIANSYEQLGGPENLKNAIMQYEQLMKLPEMYISVRAYLDKGRCYEKMGEWDKAIESYKNIADKFKTNIEKEIQDKSKTYVEKAKEVISKYPNTSGSDLDFTKNIIKKDGKEQWFDMLVMYDKFIASRKQQWAQIKSPEALNMLREYEKLTTDFIKNISAGQEFKNKDNWDEALRYYRRSLDLNFLPGPDLFEEVSLRMGWINTVAKQSKPLTAQPTQS